MLEINIRYKDGSGVDSEIPQCPCVAMDPTSQLNFNKI